MLVVDGVLRDAGEALGPRRRSRRRRVPLPRDPERPRLDDVLVVESKRDHR